MPSVYLALGSNLGDRAAHLLTARRAIATLPDTTICRGSAVYQTDPIGPPGQGPYLNAALEIQTTLPPRILMDYLLDIESEAGRVRGEKWGPRTLDLDLLLYGDQTIDVPGLTVPHPRLYERAFVLQPLCDINPALMHPVLHHSVRQLLDGLDAPALQRYEISAWSEHLT